ncbi:MAG: VWA domain-containing protein [Sandaracinus sp.]|nr:VWA domain-containing protein [Sandaracinus sp.]
MRRFLVALGFTLAACAALAWWLMGVAAAGVRFDWGGQTYELLQPTWLVVFAVTPLFALAVTRSLADLPAAQRWLGVLVRAALTALLTLAVARLARTTDATRVSTVFLVDVSESVPDPALDDARETVRAAWDARGESDVQLVTFARDAHAVPLGAEDDPVPELPRFEEADAGRGSDLQTALQLAYGLFPPGHLRRVVLLSDGNQTSDDVLAEASRARDFGVRVHVRPMRQGAPPEVAVRELVPPDRIEVGEPFPVRARVFASVPAAARLRLYQGETLNGLDSVRDIELEPGETEVEFRSIVRVAGPVTYRLTAEPKARVEGEPVPNRFAENDEFETTVVVPGKPTVLYVEGMEGRATYLARALSAADFDVDVRGPRAIPTSMRELERFDFFVLSDVSAEQVSLGQLDLIERYVRDVGGGFLFAGGENGYGLGGWQGTRMEQFFRCAWTPSGVAISPRSRSRS